MKEGIVEVIYGPMFSGKSTELGNRAKHARVLRVNFVVYNPAIDTRYGEGLICNHDGDVLIKSTPVSDSIVLLEDVRSKSGVEEVFIDEAQFFDKQLPKVVDYLTRILGIDVVLAGLLHDFRGEVFGPMGELITKAHRVTSLTAICTHELPNGKPCNGPAYFTQRLVNGIPADYNSPIVMIGGKESYTARCQEHWQIPGRPRIDI